MLAYLPFFRRLLPALGLLVLSWQQVHAQSGEFLQLMGEIKAEIKGGTRGMARGPICTPQMFDMASQAIQANEFTELMNRVVVGPLETGAKIAAGALGVPGGLISTYSLVRCYMQEADWQGLKRCVAGEAIGYAIGKGLDKAGIDGLENALAGAGWDQAFGAMREAVENYQSASETINWTAGGACQLTVTANWNKRRSPGAEGGFITGQINARECACRAPSDLEYGYLHFRVPVRYARAGTDQPGWDADTSGETRVRVKCCNMGGEGPVTHYRLDGGFSEFVRDAAEPTAKLPEAPKPPPPPPPPAVPAEPQWSDSNPCPECIPFLELAEKHRLGALDFEAEVRRVQERQRMNRERQRATQQRIDQVNRELGGREGEGGSATDPDSGLTTESMTQKDGSVRITVRDRNGKLLSEYTRQRRDLAKLRQQLESEQAELARLKMEEGKLAEELDYAAKGRDTQRKLESDARAELHRCVEEKCRKRTAAQPPQAACVFPAAQPVTIGPREKFGYGESQKGAEIGRAALGILGGFLGGGGGGPGFGPQAAAGPNLVDDPVRNKQTFTDPATGTAIKVGGQYRADGKLVVSVDVDSAQDKGVVHQVAMERMQQLPDGGCGRQIAEPVEWLHYSIWEDWWAKIRIQRYESVDGGPWRRTHDSGWQDWGSGTRLLGSGVLSADQIPGTAWGSMGADRAFGGPRAAGALFDPGKPQIIGQPAGNERLVVHVTQPGKDPVTTVPFSLYPTYGADGRVSYADKPPAAAATR